MKVYSFSIFSFLTSSDLVSKLIFFILILTSLFSWALIIERLIKYHQISKKIRNFDKNFWATHSLEDLYQKSKLFDVNPLSMVFIQAMEEWKKVGRIPYHAILDGVKERILNSMHYIKNIEIAKLEKYLYILALIGSKAPFIGLLGTVWGIMRSFESIAMAKSTSLSIVAPGLAEALMITAIGLWVAIPALIAYNFLLSRSSQFDSEIEYFIGRVYNLFSKLLDDKFIESQR